MVHARTLYAKPRIPQKRIVNEFKRAVSSSSGVTVQFKAGRVPAQRRQFELEFRSLARLAVWLDQEEESVQLVSEEYKERQC
jgi:predicted transcriptional regulator